MVEFKKGYWNIAELEIIEWIDPKQKGFVRFDLVTLKEKIIDDLNKSVRERNENKFTAKQVADIINKRFGL